jgi:peptidoglycan/xylan/chitin deacetylase (PgdA/CDA1 family)
LSTPTETDYIKYSPIETRPPIRWPDGARIAVWVAPNLEHYEYRPPASPFGDPWPRTPHPDVMSYSSRDYGNRVGFWRMLEIFDRHRIRGTVSLNVTVLEHFPEIGQAMVERDWSFMSHGVYNTRYLFGATEEEEREFYRHTREVIRRCTGKTLKGMLGPAFTSTPRTPRLMAEAGLEYQVDWFIDDQPFPINVPVGRLVGIPYSRTLNDALLLHTTAGEGEDFEQMCRDQFDVLYAEGATSGRVMCIALHPYLIGQPHRIAYLDNILTYLKSHDDVWFATADEIAQWYFANGYDADLAHQGAAETWTAPAERSDLR